VSEGNASTRGGLLFPLGDCSEALQETIKLWSGGCGLATCHVITIFELRQQYADGRPLAESVEYPALWHADQDGEPPIERERSHPVDAFSIGDNMGRTKRA
jgi:hypothetical protein